MKMSKQFNATTNQKAKFKFSVSKPNFLIPFNNNRLKRKSITPTRDQLSQSSNINNQSASLIEKKSSNTTSRCYNNRSHCNEPASKLPIKSNDLLHILHRNNPIAERWNSNMNTLEFNQLNRSASSNYNTISNININRISNKSLSITKGQRQVQGQEERKILVNVNSKNNNPSSNTSNTNKLLCKSTNEVNRIYHKTTHRSSSVNDNNSKIKNDENNNNNKGLTNYKTIEKEKENEKSNQRKMLSEMKSASESQLKIINNTNNNKSLNKSNCKVVVVPMPLASSVNYMSHYQKLKVYPQFKDHNTSPLLRTKGTKKPLKTQSPKINTQNLKSSSSSTKPRPQTDVTSMKLTLQRPTESNKSNSSRRNIGKGIYNTQAQYDSNKTNDSKDNNNNTHISIPSTSIGTPLLYQNIVSNPKKIISIDSITKKGFSGKGVYKVNQDNYFIYKNFNEEPESIFCGVCDGHGIYGHVVSDFLISYLPSMVNTALIAKHKAIASQSSLHAILIDSFIRINSKLVYNDTIDTSYSGSTCVTIIFTPEKITCANVGDSRAVIGRCINGIWSSQNLSRDHKPNELDEYERIIKSNGRIESYKDIDGNQIGPERVWVKDEDIPGLAMSRSFGDEVAQTVGVISKPEIMDYTLSQHDKFIILASDGVWEFIESDECINMIKDFYLQNDAKGALEYISKESAMRWIRQEEVIDDITALIIFLE